MSYTAQDGASVSATNVTRIDCSKCGTVVTTRWPQNEREEHELVTKHVYEKHGGRAKR